MKDLHFYLVGDDLSSNAFGRLYILAKAAALLGKVEILGATSRHGGHDVWYVCDTGEFPIKAFPSPTSSLDASGVYTKMAREIESGIVYASKPRLMSYGFALWFRKRFGSTVWVDCDDDETAFIEYPGSWYRRRLCALKDTVSFHPSRYSVLRNMQERVRLADGITVCSRFFQDRFGGVIVPHGRDAAHLDPARYDAQSLKKRENLENKKVILFLGTPQPHKGLQDLIEAFSRLDDPASTLLLIGIDPKHPPTYLDVAHPRICLRSGCSWEQLPEFLALADLVVIPQRKHLISRGQMPAKLTDAMGMAKPIVASAISDIPAYLQERGLTFEPGNVEDLQAKMHSMLSQPLESRSLGLQAREYFVRNLTYEAMSRQMQYLVPR